MSSRSEARDPPATTTAVNNVLPAARGGIHQLLLLPFFKKVFAAHFQRIPSRSEARDLSAANAADFLKNFG